jgi:thiol-disulfide isomerase/thioredoxin
MRIYMKFKSIVLAACLAAVAVSCGQGSDTQINGVAVPEGVDTVMVTIMTDPVDSIQVPVVEGKWSLSVPTDVAQYGVIIAGDARVRFIPDGTQLEVALTDSSTSVISDNPGSSVQQKLNALNEQLLPLEEKYYATRAEIFQNESLTQDEKTAKWNEFTEPFFKEYNKVNEEAFEANKGNIISVLALQEIKYDYTDAQLDSLLRSFTPALQAHKLVKEMRKALDARLETAPGKMFKDFTVNSVVGMTRSIPPQPVYNEVKLSDYVGKGKYVLLDFWAPWCGPCRREIPNIKKVYEQYGGEDFEVVSIAVWERASVQVTIDTAYELGMTWPQINNGQREPAEIYGVEGIPHLVLFGPDGKILERGFEGYEGIKEAVSKYLD